MQRRRRRHRSSAKEEKNIIYSLGPGVIFEDDNQASNAGDSISIIADNAPLLLSPMGQNVPQGQESLPLLSDPSSSENANLGIDPTIIQITMTRSVNVASPLVSLVPGPSSVSTPSSTSTLVQPLVTVSETQSSASYSQISYVSATSFTASSVKSAAIFSSSLMIPVTPSSQPPSVPSSSSASVSSETAALAAGSAAADLRTHKIEVAIGVTFAVMVGIAVTVAFVSWLLRSRKKYARCWGGEDDDKDSNFGLTLPNSWWDTNTAEKGLGLRIDEPEAGPDLLEHKVEQPRRYPAPSVTFSAPPRPPQEPVEPPFIRLPSADSAFDNQPTTTLGKLQVTNLLPGEISSDTSRPTSRIGDAPTFQDAAQKSSNRHSLGPQYGTPRETVAGSTPRFKAVNGHELPVPWSTSHTALDSRAQTGDTESALRPKMMRMERQTSDEIPPLPLPDSLRSGGASGDTLDGWGASLRSSLMSALSAVTGHPSKTGGDPALAFDSEITTGHPEVLLAGRTPSMANHFTNEGLGLGSSVLYEEATELPYAGESQDQPFSSTSTPPLVIMKKSISTSSCNSHAMRKDRQAASPSRSSSVYSSATNQRSQSLRSHTHAPAMSSNLSRRLRSRHGGRFQAKQEVLSPSRPMFLRRASSCVSANSLKSAWSNASDDSEKQAIARRTMMLRERRKKIMSAAAVKKSTLHVELEASSQYSSSS